MLNRIRSLREAFSLTQEELGEKIGVQKAAVAKYESGAVENIKRSTVEKMAEIFGVSPAFIIGWSESPHEPDAEERRLLDMFSHLNKLGKAEAIKRIHEMSFISVYSNNIIDNKTMIAAHDSGASVEEMQKDIINALDILANRRS